MTRTGVNRNLTYLQPLFQEKIDTLLQEARRQGLKVDLYEGYRSTERQNYLYEKGKSKLRGNRGWHTQGLAADIVFKDTKDNWTWNVPPSSWRKLGQIGTNLGLEWGGDWTKFRDRPHFQLKTGTIDPSSGKPIRLVSNLRGFSSNLDPKYHWYFPPEVLTLSDSSLTTRSRPFQNEMKQSSLLKSTVQGIGSRVNYSQGMRRTGVNYSRPFDIDRIQQPSLSNSAMQEIMHKGVYVPGVWGAEINRSRPFGINRIQQPSLSNSTMQEIMHKGVYVPGVWGMEINRS